MTTVLAAELTSPEAASLAQGIPESTLRYWMDDPEFAPLRVKARESLAEEMAVLARMLAQKLMEAVREGRLEPRELITGLGVTTDKMLLLSGHATSRTETRDITGDLPDDVRSRLREDIDAWLAETQGLAAPGPGADAS